MIKPRSGGAVAAKLRTGAGPQQHRSTNRNRTRGQKRRNAIKEQAQ